MAHASHKSISSYAVIRRAGAPAISLQRLKLVRTVPLLDYWLALEKRNNAGRGRVVDLLEHVIGKLERSPERLELVQLKRDVFNNRIPKTVPGEEAKAEIGKYLSTAESAALEEWLAGREKLERLSAELEQVLAEELLSVEARLRELCRKVGFRRGLEFASPSLSQDIAKYLKNPQSFTGGRKARLDRSIIRYYARSAIKLSPFSSFMRSRIVRVISAEEASAARDRFGVGRNVLLNRTFIAQLAHSISIHPELRNFVPLSLNKSIVRIGPRSLLMRHQFKMKDAKRFRVPAEAVLDIPNHAVLAIVRDILLAAGGRISYKDLIALLLPHLGEKEKASGLVEKLIAMDFLRQRIPLPEDDSTALTAFVSFLQSQKEADSRLALLAGKLENLQALEQRLETAELSELPQLLRDIQSAGRSAHHAISENPADWSGNLVFENLVEQPAGRFSVPERWRPAVDDLQGFLHTFVPILDRNSCIRESVRFLLEKEFGGAPVPFLQFAARYQKATSSGTANRGEQRNPFRLQSIARLEAIWQEVGKTMDGPAERGPVDLHATEQQMGWAARFRDLGLARSIEGILPVTCFVQPCLLEDRSAAIMLNSMSPGPWGALLRTCCGLRDPQGKTEIFSGLMQEMQQIWKSTEPCDIRATFDFNPNLHFSVTERNLDYMSDATANGNALPLGGICIALAPDGHIRLSIEGREIAPVNFGSLALQLQPPVARLLLAIGGTHPVSHSRLNAKGANRASTEQRQIVSHSQRFSYGACIIRRRSWHFPVDLLPKRMKNETSLQYLANVRKWQREFGLPDEMFVQLRLHSAGASQGKQNARSFVTRKPQYVDFGNYFLIESLGDLIEENRGEIYIEEALPRLEDWEKIGVGRPIEIAADMFIHSTRSVS